MAGEHDPFFGLEEYILVAQDQVRVDHFVRQSLTMWILTEYMDCAINLDLA